MNHYLLYTFFIVGQSKHRASNPIWERKQFWSLHSSQFNKWFEHLHRWHNWSWKYSLLRMGLDFSSLARVTTFPVCSWRQGENPYFWAFSYCWWACGWKASAAKYWASRKFKSGRNPRYSFQNVNFCKQVNDFWSWFSVESNAIPEIVTNDSDEVHGKTK